MRNRSRALAIASTRLSAPNFVKRLETCVFTVFGETCSFSAIALFDRPAAIWPSTSISFGVIRNELMAASLRSNEAEADVGIRLRASQIPNAVKPIAKKMT